MKAVLTYHSIDGSGSVISASEETLRRHVDWLLQADVPVRSLSDLTDPECSDGVALTFDDGFENFASSAWPILRRHGLPCTVFLVTDRVGQVNGWDAADRRIPELPLMDWTTLGRLVEEGVELGGHSKTHPDLRGLSGAALDVEVGTNRDQIASATGAEPVAFAYPYGRYNANVVRAVERAGFTLAVTTEMRLLDSADASRLEIPRVDTFYLRRAGSLERWGTARFRRSVQLRRGARRLRDALDRRGATP